MSSSPSVPNDPSGLVAATAAVVAFGAGNVLVKLISLPGLSLVLWRLGGAALLYIGILMARGGRVTPELLKKTFLTGLFFGANISMGYLAVKRTTVANASIIGALQPLLIVSFVSHRFGEAIERWIWLVAPVAILGTGLVILGSTTSTSWSPTGDGLAVLSMLLFVGYFAAVKQARASVDVFELQAGSLLWAAVLIAPLSVLNGVFDSLPTNRDSLLIAALVLVPGTGHALMNWAHGHIEISVASLLTLAVPVLSTIGAAMFLDESIDAVQVVGMAVVIAALAYTVKRSTAVAPDNVPSVALSPRR